MKPLLVTAALLLAMGVMLGAFGAHGLKNKLSADMLQVYQTAVQYHMYHALGILLIGVIAHLYPNASGVSWSGWILSAGIVIFSGSLYCLALTGIRWLGAITPLGGLCFIIGWCVLAYSVYRQ